MRAVAVRRNRNVLLFHKVLQQIPKLLKGRNAGPNLAATHEWLSLLLNGQSVIP